MTLRQPDSEQTERLLARFFRYVGVSSQSDGRSGGVPSTPSQWTMARLLETELRALGLADVHLDEHAVLTARLPGTVPGAPRIGFCAHIDTVDVGLSPHVHPRRVVFTGEDLCLNPDLDIWMRMAAHPEMRPYVGQEIVVTDGTSVLGADNKAAVTILLDLLDCFVREAPPHGDIVVAFVPDEEIGLRGAKLLDLTRFPVDWAYTIDGCEVGELVFETFNAAQAVIEIHGVSAHPIAAKGVLVNPLLVATELIGRFDPADTPEHTDGRQGYCWFTDMTSDASVARLRVSLRDFDDAGLERRKGLVQGAVEATQAAHPRARITCRIEDLYRNISSSLGNDRRCLDLLERGFAAVGVAPRTVPLRGGTDGSALSARGIPTPNYFTGGLNFHSRFECLPVPGFLTAYRLTERLCTLAAAKEFAGTDGRAALGRAQHR